MLQILALILKIIGIALAAILGIVLLATLLILFVPVRYHVKGDGKLGKEDPLYVNIKVRWLLRIVSLSFIYPEAAYLRVRIFGITIFNSSKRRKDKENKNKTEEAIITESKSNENVNDSITKTENTESEDYVKIPVPEDKEELGSKKTEPKETILDKILKIFKKILDIFKNIKYTILTIYDKIKGIIENIGYYLEVLRSDTFKNAFHVSQKQLHRIIKNIRPQKCDIRLALGTGDPASTGQILALYGMMYPFIGNNVFIDADFENKIAEGKFLIKGRVTLMILLISAFRIYRDKNIRHLLRLLKREEA